MAMRPLILPDTFSGEKGCTWTEWKYHFQNIATVNEWTEAQRLQWLRVRLTGRAQRAIQHLSEEDAASLEKTMKALDERFEPASQKTLFQAEFQTRRKKRSEGWAEFADDLRTLADKGFPELQHEAREQLSLQFYLQQVNPAQVAFSVKQKRPKTLDEAVAATIEMESYLPQAAQTHIATCGEEDEKATVAPVLDATSRLTSLVERLAERVESIERATKQNQQQQGMEFPPGRIERRRESREFRRTCWHCGRQGHFARRCPQAGQISPQGN